MADRVLFEIHPRAIVLTIVITMMILVSGSLVARGIVEQRMPIVCVRERDFERRKK